MYTKSIIDSKGGEEGANERTVDKLKRKSYVLVVCVCNQMRYTEREVIHRKERKPLRFTTSCRVARASSIVYHHSTRNCESKNSSCVVVIAGVSNTRQQGRVRQSGNCIVGRPSRCAVLFAAATVDYLVAMIMSYDECKWRERDEYAETKD